MSGLIWFNPPKYRGKSLDEVLAMTAPMGISERPSSGTPVTYWTDQESGVVVKLIGVLDADTDGARIHTMPREGATQSDRIILLAAAEDAFHNPPSKKAGWHFARGTKSNWWATSICVEAEQNDPVALLIARQTAIGAAERVQSVTSRQIDA